MQSSENKDPDDSAGRVSRGQAAVLAQITAGLTRPTSTDEVYGQVVTAVAEQLGSVNTALCFHDAARGTLSLHTCYKHGTVTIYGAETGHEPVSFRPFSSRSGASFAPNAKRTFCPTRPRSPRRRLEIFTSPSGLDRCCMSHSFLART